MVKISTRLTGVENGTIKRGEVPALAVRGRIATSSGLGFMVCGRAQLGDERTVGGIYRKGVTGYNRYGRSPGRERKTIIVLMRDYAPTNPRTAAQQAGRNKFADAVAAWKLLTVEQKAAYNTRVKRPGLDGYRLFISEYMRTH